MKRIPWLLVGIFYIPLALMVLISLNDWSDFFVFSLGNISISKLTFDNYALLFTAKNLPRLFLNTVVYSMVTSVAAGLLTIAGGFGMLRMGKRGRTISIAIIAIMSAIPSTVVIVPLILEIFYLKLSGLPAVMLKGMLVSSGVLVAWQFMKGIPDGYFESAEIEGANDLQIIWHIVIPISKPLFVLNVIGSGIAFMGDYLWQSLNLLQDEIQTIVVSMTNMIMASGFPLVPGAQMMRRINLEMAGGMIMLIPMVLIFLAGRKQLMNFTLEGGIKQ